MNRKYQTQDTRNELQSRYGSALILTVVLTSLLAIIGILFVMVSRLDMIATSAVSENRELDSAIDTVIAGISLELAQDVPNAKPNSFDPNSPDPNSPDFSKYYDYPGPDDKWLACLEPYESAGSYYWRQISDIYDRWDSNNLVLQAEIIDDYQPSIDERDKADADGDGVADSRWVVIPHITSSKGKRIYAAVRIVDNGGILNVNTAYEFDPNSLNDKRIDGSSQMHINLNALARGADSLGSVNLARGLSMVPTDVELEGYEMGTIWKMDDPCASYHIFDISDELILRNRYMIDQGDTLTRIKTVWPDTFDRGGAYGKNFPYTFGDDLSAWYDKVGDGDSQYYIPRHISTTYNMDRVINPAGEKMFNINDVNNPDYVEENYVEDLYEIILSCGIDHAKAAQMAVNIKDYVDNDAETQEHPNITGYAGYYGFERPCIYISEVACHLAQDAEGQYRSYAVELYKSYSEDSDPVAWQLYIVRGEGTPSPAYTEISLTGWNNNERYYVVHNVNTLALLDIPNEGEQHVGNLYFTGGNTGIYLRRPSTALSGDYYVVDSFHIPNAEGSTGWLTYDNMPHSIRRDIKKNKCIRGLWEKPEDMVGIVSLGEYNDYNHPDVNQIQAHPADKPFTNIGELGSIFFMPQPFNEGAVEADVRVDLTDSAIQKLFNYLTVFDPNERQYGGHPATETRVKGRININTAPWYVLAQLPWVSQKIDQQLDYHLAQLMVVYREAQGAFESIGELNNVTSLFGDPIFWIDYYARDYNPNSTPKDQNDFPDLTPADSAANDYEERDLIFSRISNLVTVRSDVFTAYILVRIGRDGPQKRAIAILDRSRVDSPDDKVRIVALHPVPDPR